MLKIPINNVSIYKIKGRDEDKNEGLNILNYRRDT
jgi:hypothetical protein